MRFKQYPILLVALLIPLIAGPGCRSGGKKAPGSIDLMEAGDIVDRIETMKQVYHLCPSPAEMLSVIDVAELQYDGDLLNPIQNADRYLDTRSRTLALGLYVTDLAYAALFGRHEETLNYLAVVRELAEQIHVTGAINDDLINKARTNVDYLDSLFNISNEAFVNMLFYCERNDRPGTMIMLSAGAFIESLYLAIELVDDYETAGYILTHIADQKYALDNLMAFADSMVPVDDNITSLKEDLGPIHEIFQGIETGGSDVRIKTEQEATGDSIKKLVVGSRNEKAPLISLEQFEQLRDETNRLRSKVVEG